MRYAHYNYILVDNEEQGYRLHIDGYSGDAGMTKFKVNGNILRMGNPWEVESSPISYVS